MKTDLQILMIEDNPTDSELVEFELRKGGWNVRLKRVETRDEFAAALEGQAPDLILSDHGLPSFDGFAAMAMAQERCPDVPFVFVTGAMGEERIIQTFESGATDYVLKNQLAKLVPVVRRALRETEERHLRQRAEADREGLILSLQEALSRIRSYKNLLPICAGCKKVRNERGQWKAVEVFLREHYGITSTHGLCPECKEMFQTPVELGGS